MSRFFLCLLVAAMGLTAFAQDRGELFEDPEGKYKINLPPGWTGIVSRDGLGRVDVKVVYKVNENGTLKLRRAVIEEGMTPLEFAKREEAQTHRFVPGYAKGAIEVFTGGVDGALVTYDFTVSGRPMLGRAYYVKVNPTTIYSLRFTGLRNVLGPIRNHTDAIARSIKGE